MNSWAHVTMLAPEICMIGGACLLFLVGVSKSATTRSLTAPLALLVLLTAMAATYQYGQPLLPPPAAELAFSPLTWYIRWIALLVGLLIVLINWQVPAENERGEFFGLIICSISGVMLTGSANDLVVLFLALELVSVPTYILVALSRTDQRASEAAMKYFFLGALAAAVTVYGFSILYGSCGTTVLRSATGAAIADQFADGQPMGNYALIGMLLAFAGLSFKVAAVPFHAYAPDVYEGAASPVTGLLGFLPKAAGFVAMIKLLSTCNWQLPETLMWMLWIVAATTMTLGNVLALLQTNVKRMLAYSSIAHSGYMIIGLLVGPVLGAGPMGDGVAALLFYLLIYGVMNLGAFGMLANFSRKGQPVETLDDLAGVSRRTPLSAVGLAVCVFSLMGFPPTAGFLGKFYIFSSALSVGEWHPFHGPLVVLVVIAVINSAIGAAYYLRIAATCFLREPTEEVKSVGSLTMHWALTVCAVAMIVLFARPNAVVRQAQLATQDLIPNPSAMVAQADNPTS